MRNGKISVLFIIPTLTAHGAERQLCELAKNMDSERFDIHVAVYYDPGYYNGGELWAELEEYPGVTLHALHKRFGPAGYIAALPRIFVLALRFRTKIIHGYLEGNIPAFIIGQMMRIPVVWGIRIASIDSSKGSQVETYLERLFSSLSRFVDLVIFNSEAGLHNHQANLNFSAKRMEVIANGIDVGRFVPDSARGAAQRALWGVQSETPLIGIVGRHDPQKDHKTFFRAAARVAAQWPRARFVCVGGGPDSYTQLLKGYADSLGLSQRIIWAGKHSDMAAVYNALTLLVLSSTDEGFPNVIGEAMACGVACVTTRAGDAEAIVGDTGIVVNIGDDASIAHGVGKLLSESASSHAMRSARARTRICDNFSVQLLSRHTENALLALV